MLIGKLNIANRRQQDLQSLLHSHKASRRVFPLPHLKRWFLSCPLQNYVVSQSIVDLKCKGILYFVDWTGLDWTGLVKRGLVNRGLVKRDSVNVLLLPPFRFLVPTF